MRFLILCGLLMLGGCDDPGNDTFNVDMGPSADPGCGTVDFCLDFLSGDGASFTQCVLPFLPADDTPAANGYYKCALKEGLAGGACASPCTPQRNDLGASNRPSCESCLHTHGCAAEANACNF